MDKKIVRYEDFGAIGDGVTDDFDALYAAHIYANENHLPVTASEGAVYYIGEKFNKTIPLKTDLCLKGAKIIVDDTVDNAFEFRQLALYTFDRDRQPTVYDTEAIASLNTEKIDIGQKKVEWLGALAGERCMVMLVNDNHKDFVRFGSNENAGKARSECILIDADGTVDPSTPVVFNFDDFTAITIFPIDDDPITLEGGYFENICCRACAATEYKNKYRSFARGIRVHRPNSVIRGVTHRVVNEPKITGELNESYPYYGFIGCINTYNVLVEDADLCGHTTYYEDKPARESTNWVKPKPVPMGSYDIIEGNSILITYRRLRQNATDIRARRYWGIMASNGCKNLEFYDSVFSRFDAHCGVWGAKIVNCELGHAFNLVGGGRIEVINTKKHGSRFINVRGDYGSDFGGDVIIKDCTLLCDSLYYDEPKEEESEEAIIFNLGFRGDNEKYCNWDFGYPCHMPRNIVMDNFTCPAREVAMFNSIEDLAFDKNNKNPYALTENITFVGMKPYKMISGGDGSAVMESINITVEPS